MDGWEPSHLAPRGPARRQPQHPGCDLTASERLWIDAWNEFVETWFETTDGRRPPGMPIWADAWNDVWTRGRDAPNFGPSPDYRDLMAADPSLPQWKAGHLAKNYALFIEHEDWLSRGQEVGDLLRRFPASRRKLGVAGPGHASTVGHGHAVRPSGIRAKRPTYLPALVAITQTSIVGPRERRLSPRETARMQGLPEWFDFGDSGAGRYLQADGQRCERRRRLARRARARPP